MDDDVMNIKLDYESDGCVHESRGIQHEQRDL